MSRHYETCYEFSPSCLLLVNLAAFAIKDVFDSPILNMVYMVVEEPSVREKDPEKEAVELVQRCQRTTKGILREGEVLSA
jgi:hypothetical protein